MRGNINVLIPNGGKNQNNKTYTEKLPIQEWKPDIGIQYLWKIIQIAWDNKKQR